MPPRLLSLTLALLLALTALARAQPRPSSATPGAGQRRALVIGNDKYTTLRPLKNAVADARAVAQALESLGFEVLKGENLDYKTTNRLHANFEAALGPGDQAFVFFAGHGVALGAENYLLPVDMATPQAGEENLVRTESHAVDMLVRRVQGRGVAATFMVLDACRNNPFEVVGGRSIGAARGLARVDAPTGVFVLFSAGIGQLALDRLSEKDRAPNSVFTRVLVPLLTTPGLSHLTLAKRVQTEVDALAASVFHEQQPAFYDQVKGEIVFKPGPAPVPTSPASTPTPIPTPPTQVAVNVPPVPVTTSGQTLHNSLGMEFVRVPAGEFRMGSEDKETSELEKPVHTVRLTRAFYLGKHEVTQGQWQAVMGNNPSRFTGDANRPVERVSWDDVQQFLAKLNAREPGVRYRLPTEAEWEYAARAGSTTAYSFGNDAGPLGAYAWYHGNAGKTPHPVGQKMPNAWGLYDMHGNVWEWVQDWFDSYTRGAAVDPPGPAAGAARVIRGGGWYDDASNCWAANRGIFRPVDRCDCLGFRLLREIP